MRCSHLQDDHYFESVLREKRKALVSQLGSEDGREKGRAFRESVTDYSFADNHPADLGSENFERSKDLSLQEQQLTRLRMIDEALERIGNGTYGVCRRCGQEIPRERLEAIPETALCIHCQDFEERQQLSDPNRRPVEESLLSPPFMRHIVQGDPGPDAEDFWQEAARHNKRPRIAEDGLEGER